MDLRSWAFSGWAKLPGSTPSAPSTASDGHTVWLAVRGMDNGIYLNRLNGLGWSGWRRISGSTVAAPAIEFKDVRVVPVVYAIPALHLAVIGSDGKSIWYTQVNDDIFYNHQYIHLAHWSKILGTSPSPVALAHIPP